MYNSVYHAFALCPALNILRQFIKLNLRGITEKYITPILLFGVSCKRSNNPKTQAIEYALSSIRSLLAEQLATSHPLDQHSIRAILISTSARYSLLAMKIPCASEAQWTYAGELIKFYPDGAQWSLKFLQRLIRRYKNYQRFLNV
ncbi:Uncharacterized protein FKW44_016642 [Caligus rogercresseyi]|uniref:Uncharacterized protein n=1 Tax=Caligus rogercresseyi TaxID=217165 RepID=A0A7T8H282_CALRO|nr:Uncharacterized protein FKW44_016642 [Caligus rogercresseyi]